MKERPLPWAKCPEYNRKVDARSQEIKKGEYQPSDPDLLGISKTRNLLAEAAQVAVGFTLARSVQEAEEQEHDRPKCLVFHVTSENPCK